MADVGNLYKSMNRAWWAGRLVRARVDLQSGEVIIPQGASLRVIEKRKGLTVAGAKCEHCGITPIIMNVDPYALELLATPEVHGAIALVKGRKGRTDGNA